MYDLEIALSGDIDDGREDLERCLRPLAEMLTTLDIPMTIPVVAEALQQHPRKIERLRDAGIEIAGHGDIHQPFVGPVGVQVKRLQAMNRVFKEILGDPPIGFRAPFLAHDENLYPALAKVGLEYDSSRVARDIVLRLRYLFSRRPLAFSDPTWRLPSMMIQHLSGEAVPRPHTVAPGVLELPVFELDDWFFIESHRGPRLRPEEGAMLAETWLRAVRHFRRKGYVLVLQAHPMRISPSHLGTLEYFIDAARNLRSGFFTLSQLSERCSSRSAGGLA